MIDAQIVQLGDALERAAAEDNWNQLQQVDSRINRLLAQLKEEGVNDVTRRHLNQLQQRHRLVAQVCRQRVDELRHRLQQHQEKKEGMQAYAMFSQDEEY